MSPHQEFKAPKRYQLDTLPIEIIRRIASNGPFSSTISLLKVNRTLYHACNDWTVFQENIANNANYVGSRPKWYLTSAMQSDKSFLSRYACADLKGTQFLCSIDEFAPTQPAKWAPHLMAMHHPILSPAHTNKLSKIIKHSQPGDSLALRFCLAACSMFENKHSELGHNTRIQFYADLKGQDLAKLCPEELRNFYLNLDVFPSISTNGGLSRLHDPSSSTFLILPMAYKALHVIYYELLSEIKRGVIDKSRYSQMTLLPPKTIPLPPTALNIPFSSLMEVPSPFSLGCAEMFSTCHLPIMTSPAFIESGEWTGYYGPHLNQPFAESSSSKFDSPMEGIKFSVREDEAAPGVLNLLSNGNLTDFRGAFHFEGQMMRGTGKINLRKFWENDPTEMYLQALITPFGILASHHEGGVGHWMWLWKTEWSARS